MDDCKKKLLSDRELREKEVYGTNGPPRGVEGELTRLVGEMHHLRLAVEEVAVMFEFVVERMVKIEDEGDA